MYKKNVIVVLLIIGLLSSPLLAWSRCCPLNMTAEVRTACFFPSSNKVRHIYGSGWPEYQLEITKGIGCHWGVMAGVSGFSQNGRFCHHSTRLQIIPITLGFKYHYCICNSLKFTVGAAASYSFLNIRGNFEDHHKSTRKDGWGVLIQTALKYSFCDWVFVSVFADYLYQYFHLPHERNHSHCHCHRLCETDFPSHLNMSGFKVGAGVGIPF